MVREFVSSAVARRFKPTTMTLVFIASQLSMRIKGQRLVGSES